MAKIYRVTDRLTLKIADFECSIAPLTYHQKSEIIGMMTEGQSSKNLMLLNQAVYKTVQYSLKDLKGVEDVEGQPYQLQFNGDQLTDACLDDLLRMEGSSAMMQACTQLLNDFANQDFSSLEGVQVVQKKTTQPTT